MDSFCHDELLICGATCRALAQSAAAIGCRVTTIDLFADQDTRTVADAKLVVDYPGGIGRLASELPPMRWMYTGGLENYPELIDLISQRHKLVGVDAAAARRVKDVFVLQQTLADTDVPFPETLPASRLPGKGEWLLKPYVSAGGSRVQFASQAGLAKKMGQVYAQRWIAGQPVSATYVACGGRCQLLGVCRQLLGDESSWRSAPLPDRTLVHPFRYIGSVGPLELNQCERRQFESIGDLLSRRFHLTGVFGVDAVQADAVWAIEVNPRPTASLEVLERSLGINGVALHIQAAEGTVDACSKGLPDSVCGKMVLFARHALFIESGALEAAAQQRLPSDRALVADIPCGDQSFEPGDPVCTIVADAASAEDVAETLQRYGDQLMQELSLTNLGRQR